MSVSNSNSGMDEKLLQAICGQLAELQLQVEALRQMILRLYPKEQGAKLHQQLLDVLYQDASEIRESIRTGIRQGIVIQQFHDIEQGHLWDTEDPPQNSADSPTHNG